MNYEDNFQKQLSMMENLTNAHNALSDTVNKHIEFTTALADKVRIEYAHNSEVQCKLSFDIQKLRVHITILYICTLITMITIGWKLL